MAKWQRWGRRGGRGRGRARHLLATNQKSKTHFLKWRRFNDYYFGSLAVNSKMATTILSGSLSASRFARRFHNAQLKKKADAICHFDCCSNRLVNKRSGNGASNSALTPKVGPRPHCPHLGKLDFPLFFFNRKMRRGFISIQQPPPSHLAAIHHAAHANE